MSHIQLNVINTTTQSPTGQPNPTGTLTIQTIVFGGEKVDEYENYNFHQNFMQPADQWTIKIGKDRVSEEQAAYLQPKATVFLNLVADDSDNFVGSRVISTGFIDQVKLHNYREGAGGSYYEVRGRSNLAMAIDDGIDPWSKMFDFVEGTTLGELFGKVFSQYGLNVIWAGTDASKRDVVTGVDRTNPSTRLETSTITIPNEEQEAFDEGFLEGPPQQATTITITQYIDPTAPVDLEQLKTKKLKPKDHETAYSFCETHAKRFQLHIWGAVSNDGTDWIVVGRPDYTQGPLYNFVNNYDGSYKGTPNNVHESWIELDSVNMPAAIIAKGETGGGDFATTTVKCAKVNEFVGYLPGAASAFNSSGNSQSFNSQYIKSSVASRIDRFKALPIVAPVPGLLQFQDNTKFFNQSDTKFSPVIYWHDPTSKTQAQLESAVQRRMSEFMRTAIRLHIKVDGHDQNGYIYRMNTIATINDEKLGFKDQAMWIEDVQFRKSRHEGTVTELVLLPLNILFFGGVATNSAGSASPRVR